MSRARGEGRNGRPWRTARAKVLARSRICAWCGKDGADTVDHIVPTSMGGAPLDPANLQPMHRSCNSKKGNGTGRKLPTSREW